MNINSKTENISPQSYARIGGILYLIIIATGMFGELFVRGKLLVPGDAVTTANNIMSSELLWRLGIAGDLIMHICDIPLMLIIYVLLKPVNKNLALVSLLFTLVQTAVMVATKLNLFTPLFLLGNAEYLKSFQINQLNTLLYLSVKSDSYGFSLGLIFFGCACLITGYLIYKATYFPKMLGILMQIAGLCYLVNSFALILSPEFSNKITPAILLPCFIGELSFCLWLMFKGVNVSEWEIQQSGS